MCDIDHANDEKHREREMVEPSSREMLPRCERLRYPATRHAGRQSPGLQSVRVSVRFGL